MPVDRRRRPPVVTAVVMSGLLVVAAIASGAAGDEPGDGATLRLPTPSGLLTAAATAAFVVGAGVLIVMLIIGARQQGRPPMRERRLLRTVLVFVVLMALALFLPRSERGDQEDGTTGTGPTPLPGLEDAEPDRAAPGEVAAVLVVLAVGVAAALAAASRARAGAGRGDLAGHGEHDDLAAARALADVLDDAVDDLRTTPDPRLAVIAAYDRMERILAGHGLARRRSEAPLEYLPRVLAVLDASGPAGARLTALFERAMFSLLPVDRAEQDAAVDALVAVRDELRALR